ncbi:uncharacterized protein PFL1_04385 [Pseudozyma flocculosa PF-1]|uniref:Major facilitator superfamily (MFS) profile domain-containing protein n=2 Tax=Pseudozyma flocculosa TaxID=84751 RepID=A0A5C3FEV6_9BASI|nr:uncharacterized protein PFL1_04385 [Pseudozyma flocculosa PF-1]EPQ28058.1 hypothetical protein PFL1_04385 [Pseudozyma flocculosa PF-1]SPO42207.1 uncharacterized protein PSFLO_07690 [Pseudozyma flocculosa]
MDRLPSKPVRLVQQLSPNERKVAFASICIFGAVLSLDRLTAPSYQTVAASSLDSHSLLTLVAVVRSIAAAVAGPTSAQLCEMGGLLCAYVAGVVLYAAGCLVMASAPDIAVFALGGALYELGANGLIVAQSVLIASATSPRIRLFSQTLPQLSFAVLGYPSASIYAAVLKRWGWRSGLGMFAALGPASLLPLLVVMFNGSRRTVEDLNSAASPTFDARLRPGWNGTSGDAAARKDEGGAVKPGEQRRPIEHIVALLRRLWTLLQLADAVGLFLLLCSVAAVLLPLLLAAREPSGWSSPHILLPLVLGLAILLPAFALWERWGAVRPVLPVDLVRSRAWLLPALVTALFWAAHAIQGSYLATYLYVALGASARAQQSVAVTYSVADCLFGVVLVSALVRATGRLYPFQVLGLAVGVAGIGLMLALRTSSDLARIAVAQAVLGTAGSLVVAPLQVSVQVSLDEHRLATAVGALNLFNALGSAVGSAAAGSIWSGALLPRLSSQVELTSDDVRSVYSEPLAWIQSHALGSAKRTAVVLAYRGTWTLVLSAAAGVAGLALLVGLFLPNPILDKERQDSGPVEG